MTGVKFRPYNLDRFSLGSQAAPGGAVTGVTTGTGVAISFHDSRQVSWEAIGSGTITSGVIKIETNDVAQDYAGTWAELDSIDATTLSAGLSYHGTYPGPVGWVRARISTNIGGGGNVAVPLNGLLQ